MRVRNGAEVATDPDLTVFSRNRSSFIRRCGSESEFGFAPSNNLGTTSALHSAKTFFFGFLPKFWQKKRPNF